MVPCWHSSIQVYYGLAEFPLLTPKQHRVMVPCWSLCWVSLECLLIWWKISNVYFDFHFSGLFSTKTFKQHRVMVPCWPLCWASLAPAAQHESDNQGIVHLTPSSSTFSHHGCILYSVLLYSVLCTSPPTPPSSHITARWTQKSPNHPKPFKSATSRFWVTLFPFHSFSDFHHTRSDRKGRKMILKISPY